MTGPRVAGRTPPSSSSPPRRPDDARVATAARIAVILVLLGALVCGPLAHRVVLARARAASGLDVTARRVILDPIGAAIIANDLVIADPDGRAPGARVEVEAVRLELAGLLDARVERVLVRRPRLLGAERGRPAGTSEIARIVAWLLPRLLAGAPTSSPGDLGATLPARAPSAIRVEGVDLAFGGDDDPPGEATILRDAIIVVEVAGLERDGPIEVVLAVLGHTGAAVTARPVPFVLAVGARVRVGADLDAGLEAITGSGERLVPSWLVPSWLEPAESERVRAALGAARVLASSEGRFGEGEVDARAHARVVADDASGSRAIVVEVDVALADGATRARVRDALGELAASIGDLARAGGDEPGEAR